MSKVSLTPDQLKRAEELDKKLSSLLTLRDTLDKFKLNEVFILEEWSGADPKKREVVKNNMGLPIKYKVVYVSQMGVPYLRSLNAKGNPVGDVHVPHELEDMFDKLTTTSNQNFWSGSQVEWHEEFVPDPEALDALLLQEEFKPTARQHEKVKLFAEINKYNKSIAIPTSHKHFQKIAEFFKSLNPGDKYWTSPDKAFVIQSVTKGPKEWQVKVKDMSQQEHVHNFSYFHFKRIYKAQPRSFTKETKT